MKRLWKTASDKYLALMAHCMTPFESIGLSFAQLLMGQRACNKLPAAPAALAPMSHAAHKVRALLDRDKVNQEYYCNKKLVSDPQPPLHPNDKVRIAPHTGSHK